MNLYISEIFKSVQGESSFSGMPCIFIRLAGCNLRCRYCDTRYAQELGEQISLGQILTLVASYSCRLVEITGGEPLIQRNTPDLAIGLMKKGYRVLVETNGSQDISVLPEGAVRIMDIKCPSSGESDQMLWGNLETLTQDDEIKFVISDRRDYEWARHIMMEQLFDSAAQILFSTVFGQLHPRSLVKWMLDDNIQARFQLQIHKYIWPPDTQGV